MIAPMFWNLCKSSWRKGLLFELLIISSLLLSHFEECSSGRSLGCGVLFEGHSLKDGKKAGLFNKLGRTSDVTKCVEYCCADSDCKTALFVGKLEACYTVDCGSLDACKSVPALKTSRKYGMSVFQKYIKEGNSKNRLNGSKMNDNPNRPLLREKRHESCHHYHGTQCTKYFKNKLLYFNQYPPSVEKRLFRSLPLLKPRLSSTCEQYALAGICHYAFPYCSDRANPTPLYLCREDCEQLHAGVCKQEFKIASKVAWLMKILPDCEKLPSSTGLPGNTSCTSLNIPDSLRVFSKRPTISQSTTAIINNYQTQDKPDDIENQKDEDNLNSFNKKVNTFNKDNENIKQNQNTVDTNKLHQNKSVEASSKASYNRIGMSTDVEKNDKQFDDVRNNLSPTGKSLSSSTDDVDRGRVMSSDSAADENSDLDTPKDDQNEEKSADNSNTSNIPTSPSTKAINLNNGNVKDEERVRKDDDEKIKNIKKGVAQLPTRDSTRQHGLGLQESLGMLEPTDSSSKKLENDTSLPSPQMDQPTVVNISSNSADEINLAVTNTPSKGHGIVSSNKTVLNASHSAVNASVTSSPTKPATGAPAKSPIPPTEAPTLQVSAGENKVLTLPTNSIELYASAFPKETSGNPYTYHWQQISAPQDSHGYMEGKDTRRVILSKLSHVGVYQFKVTVKGTKNGAFGFAFVNVTVRPAPRVNKPPRADISPKEQTITLPTNMVVLDGSKSSDDDKITQYKWEEVKGPLNDKNKMISSGADSPVLQLKSLVPGIYTFKLTVVDSDGEKDSTTATVTVNDEKDYPPVARAGNDVVLTLPINHLTLYGNGSTDDKGIVSYEWSKAPSSPAVGDMQGTNSPILKVSNMVVGDYTFILKVTDTGGQTASSKVTVVVQPEKNTPPVAKAGSDKDLVYPDDSTTLDAKGSHDDQKIVKYHWEQQSGPSSAEISGADDKIATVKKLQEGHYVFKLTVTDDKGLTGTDIVAVNVKKDINQNPVARAGPDVVVHLPNRAAELDGSKSSDDHGIAEYIWYRDPKSPAAGDVINNSNHQAVLRLSNLVEGMYKFRLTVVDAKGLKSSDEALLTVKEDENSAHLVELYLDVDITKFTEENKGQLIRKLAVILDVQDDDIVVEHLKEAGTGHSMMVMFYVKGAGDAKDGQIVAEMLKSKIENEEGFFEFRMLRVEPYICRNNCSFHGYCDRRTKLCVCESFWMQNIFKSSFGVKESNCDWSILYVTVIIFGIVMGIGGIIWGICFCMGRRRGRSRRRHRYAIIDEDDDDKAERMEMLPKGNYSSMMLSDSDEDSDETTLFEAKKRIPNGTLNGSVGRKAM